MPQESEGTIADDIGRRGIAASIAAEEPLATVRLSPVHRIRDFNCSKSARVSKFIQEQAHKWVEQRYCGVFVLPDADDPTKILAYYSLSQFVLARNDMKKKHKDRQTIATVPLVKVGYMGKQDGAIAGLGAAMLVDAARRAHRQLDIPSWGLTLEPEGGKENSSLWGWYEKVGFIPAINLAGHMYAPFEALIPELTKSGA
jgi:hypothetical protein